MMIEHDTDHRHHLLAIASPRSERLAHFGARDIGWQALGPAIACAILSTAVVGLRWYTRARLVRCLGWDDYVILLSLVNYSPFSLPFPPFCLVAPAFIALALLDSWTSLSLTSSFPPPFVPLHQIRKPCN